MQFKLNKLKNILCFFDFFAKFFSMQKICNKYAIVLLKNEHNLVCKWYANNMQKIFVFRDIKIDIKTFKVIAKHMQMLYIRYAINSYKFRPRLKLCKRYANN